jgi:hypothetical protein
LAESVTRQEKSTTQKILALTEYLRSKYAYSDVVEVPAESDPIAWFLFEGKEGFCNYYASAEVLMLRSLGIPARMAVGYAQGDYSNEKNAYEVRARDSHAWVEVFYPEVGWVIFEPTPSQPAIVYRESRSGTDDETIDLTNGGQAESLEEEISEATRDPEIDLVIDDPISSGNGILNRRNLITASGLALSLTVLIFALRGFILRKKAIRLPISVQKFLQDREVKIPKFVQKWAEYERLPPIVKNYRILKLLTIKLKLMPTENFTPREFMSAINRIVRVDSRTGRMFIDWLDESLYGRSIGKYTAGMRHTFKGYLKLIGREWISRVLGSLKFKRTDQTNQ